jgi:hypothetical protein
LLLFLEGDFDLARMDKAEPSVAGHSADRHHFGELRFDGFRPDTAGDSLCAAYSADFAVFSGLYMFFLPYLGKPLSSSKG